MENDRKTVTCVRFCQKMPLQTKKGATVQQLLNKRGFHGQFGTKFKCVGCVKLNTKLVENGRVCGASTTVRKSGDATSFFAEHHLRSRGVVDKDRQFNI